MKRTLAASAAAATMALTLVMAPAVAATKPSKADVTAMKEANAYCASVQDDVQFENCVVGEYLLSRYMDPDFYTYNNNGEIVPTEVKPTIRK